MGSDVGRNTMLGKVGVVKIIVSKDDKRREHSGVTEKNGVRLAVFL